MTAKDSLDKNKSNIRDVKDIEKQIKEYKKLMQEAASNLEFESAVIYRDKIKELEQIYLKS